jgi:hypothetical protein
MNVKAACKSEGLDRRQTSRVDVMVNVGNVPLEEAIASVKTGAAVTAALPVLPRQQLQAAAMTRPATSAAPEPRPAMPQVQVKTYKNADDYERDAPRMAADGWTPQGQTSGTGGVRIGRTVGKAVLTGGIGLVVMGRSRKGDPITVTWVKPGQG